MDKMFSKARIEDKCFGGYITEVVSTEGNMR